MPKSTATMRPSFVDEEIALMHVGVEEPVAQRGAQKSLNQGARQRAGIKSELGQTVRDRPAEPRRSIPSSSLRAWCGSSRPPAHERPGPPWNFRRIPTLPPLRAGNPSPCAPSARASRRPGQAAAGETPAPGSRRVRAAKTMSARSRANRRSVPARSTFTATGRTPSPVFTSARWTWAIEAAATGSPKLSNSKSIFVAERRLDDGDRGLAAHWRDAVLQPLELDGDLAADDVGTGRKELSRA